MPSSSLRNAVKRITHKERSQPRKRQKVFGPLLEKKEDYRQRSHNYHRKQRRLNQLRQLATTRNPDEFYFGMHRGRIDEHTGRHMRTVRSAGQDDLPSDAIRMLKTQDVRYVRLLAQRDETKVRKLQSTLHYLNDGDRDGGDGDEDVVDEDGTNKNKKQQKRRGKKKHTIFVHSQTDAEDFDVARHFDTVPELAGRAFHRPRKQTLLSQQQQQQEHRNNESQQDDDVDIDVQRRTSSKNKRKQQRQRQQQQERKIAKARASSYRQLEAHKQRSRTLKRTLAIMEVEHLLSTSKGRKRKVREGQNGYPPIYKWRRKRLG